MKDKKIDIFNSGRKLFYDNGFKNTSISDIAEYAGIGVGTFYNYYDSKEDLFMEIYFKENEDLKEKILKSLDLNDNPKAMIKKMIIQNINEMNNNAILKEWYNKDLFVKLEKQFYKQDGISKFDKMTSNDRLGLIKNWQDEGKIRKDIDVKMINAIFNAILYIDIHKEDVGIEYYPEIIVYITEFIMDGITGNNNNIV